MASLVSGGGGGTLSSHSAPTLKQDRSRSKEVMGPPHTNGDSGAAGSSSSKSDQNPMFSNGTMMIKYCKKPNKAPHQRLFKFEVERRLISWRSTGTRKHTTILVDDIKEVRRGQKTEAFTLFPWPEREDYSFSIIHGVDFVSLDLICSSRKEREIWVCAIEKAMESTEELDEEIQMQNFLRQSFTLGDRNNDNKLDLSEVMVLLRRFNLNMPKKTVNDILLLVDSDKNGTLDFDEFTAFYKRLRRRADIRELYQTLVKWDGTNLSLEAMHVFLTETQKMSFKSYDEYLSLIERYTTNNEITFDGFVRFLDGRHGHIFLREKHTIFQDMTQPLCHYYINSSHNTYLSGDQLRGKSTTEAYIRALLLGCRCVELDCWDGSNNEPLIYHGHTLTTRILFKDVILAIKKYAFVTSPYPVILSFENHCSIPQQKVMAKYLIEILGDNLLREPLGKNETRLPSPEALKYKILIKGKKLPPDGHEGILEEEEDDEEDDGQASLTPSAPADDENADTTTIRPRSKSDYAPSTSISDSSSSLPSVATTASGNSSTTVPKSNTLRMKFFGRSRGTAGAIFSNTDASLAGPKANGTMASAGEVQKKKSRKPDEVVPAQSSSAKRTKLKIAEELSSLVVYTRSIAAKDVEKSGSFNEMPSFGERRSERFIQATMQQYIRYNRHQLSRIYPAGSRVDSSNLDPRVHWNAGCQLVALNYQTTDRSMQLNYGLFTENGRCGYVLKPASLRLENAPAQVPKRLTLHIISAIQLPKFDMTKDRISSPCVEVEIVGADIDTLKKRTHVIQENGWNPVFNKKFDFDIHEPDLAFVRFVVNDVDGNKDDFLASYTLPLRCIGEGYRHVQLLDAQLNIVPLASVYLHVKIEPLEDTKRTSSDTDSQPSSSDAVVPTAIVASVPQPVHSQMVASALLGTKTFTNSSVPLPTSPLTSATTDIIEPTTKSSSP